MEEYEIFMKPSPRCITKLYDMQLTFFIDISASTMDSLTQTKKIIDVEIGFIKDLSAHLTLPPLLVSWASTAQVLNDLAEIKPGGNTDPVVIFDTEEIDTIIDKTEVAVIITDGEITGDNIKNFAQKMRFRGKYFQAVLGIIVGRRTNDDNVLINPGDINVSVLLPAMLANSCILLHNSLENYVMWSSGPFAQQLRAVHIDAETRWRDISTVSFGKLATLDIPHYSKSMINNLHRIGYHNYGDVFFNPNMLLTSSPSISEILSFPFDIICRHFRSTSRYSDLLSWTIEQKNRLLQLLLDEQIQSSIISVDDLFRLFDRVIESMNIDIDTQCVGSAYTAASLSSNRYSITNRPIIDKKNDMPEITVTLEQPLTWIEKFMSLHNLNHVRSIECGICVEKDIPFVIIRDHITQNNIDDFINNPTNYFYPQVVCRRCADFFCKKKEDPVRVGCIAAMPLMSGMRYKSNNNYITIVGKFITNTVDRNIIDFIITLLCDTIVDKTESYDLVSIIKEIKNSII